MLYHLNKWLPFLSLFQEEHLFLQSYLGYWEAKDCKAVSDAAGLMLYLSYQSLEDSDKVKKEGNKRKADELAGEGVVLAQLAADYATTFSAFCK